jgi:phage gpG-like protein
VADAVRIEGYAELRRDLRALPREAGREFQKGFKAGAEVVATAARPLAVRRTGRLAESFRAGTSGNSAFVRSRLPYAGVQEFGGVIRPKGAAIAIAANPAVTRALDENADKIADTLGDGFDAAARRLGFR